MAQWFAFPIAKIAKAALKGPSLSLAQLSRWLWRSISSTPGQSISFIFFLSLSGMISPSLLVRTYFLPLRSRIWLLTFKGRAKCLSSYTLHDAFFVAAAAAAAAFCRGWSWSYLAGFSLFMTGWRCVTFLNWTSHLGKEFKFFLSKSNFDTGKDVKVAV